MPPRSLLCLCAAAALCLAVHGAPLLARPERDCLSPSLAQLRGFDFFPEDYRSVISAPAPVTPGAVVTDAVDFDIKYYDTYKVVTLKRAKHAYVLYQCGTPNPARLPAGAAEGVTPGMAAFEIPLHSIAVTDTTVNGFLSELGVLDRVSAASPLSVNACLQRLAAPGDGGCGLAAPDGYFDASDAAAAKAFAAANASMYGAADAVFVGFSAASPKDILFTATADPGPLNRAEWVKYAAAFFNKEIDANRLYGQIKSTYNALKQAAAAARAASPAPRVAWLSTNASGVSFRLDPYKTALIRDAGGAPLTADELRDAGAALTLDPVFGTSAAFLPRTSKALGPLLSEVGVIVDETFYAGAPGLANVSAALGFESPVAAREAVPAIARGMVIRWDGNKGSSGGSGWFEDAVARPDWVLMDLVRAVTPEAAAAAGGGAALVSSGPGGEDFHFAVQLGAPAPRGSPRLTSAAACAGGAACGARTPEAICPNAFRDCKTGQLTAADPALRCRAWSVCEPPAPAAGVKSGARGARRGAAAALLGGAAGALAAALL